MSLITLQQIHDHNHCEGGWEALLRGLGTWDLATEVTIADVAVINTAERGIERAVQDALWCLRCIGDPRLRVRAVLPAVKRASAHTQDQRVHGCIADLERWLEGDDSVDLEAARNEAEAAALSAESATDWAAAEAAARAAWTAAASAEEEEDRAAWVMAAAGAAAEAAARAVREAKVDAKAQNDAKRAEYQAQLDDLVALFGLHAARRVANIDAQARIDTMRSVE
jgi:hypothetical protein